MAVWDNPEDQSDQEGNMVRTRRALQLDRLATAVSRWKSTLLRKVFMAWRLEVRASKAVHHRSRPAEGDVFLGAKRVSATSVRSTMSSPPVPLKGAPAAPLLSPSLPLVPTSTTQIEQFPQRPAVVVVPMASDGTPISPPPPPPPLAPLRHRGRHSLLPGMAGLRNLGQTCFMNAILQALGHISIVRLPFSELRRYSAAAISEANRGERQSVTGNFSAIANENSTKKSTRTSSASTLAEYINSRPDFTPLGAGAGGSMMGGTGGAAAQRKGRFKKASSVVPIGPHSLAPSPTLTPPPPICTSFDNFMYSSAAPSATDHPAYFRQTTVEVHSSIETPASDMIRGAKRKALMATGMRGGDSSVSGGACGSADLAYRANAALVAAGSDEKGAVRGAPLYFPSPESPSLATTSTSRLKGSVAGAVGPSSCSAEDLSSELLDSVRRGKDMVLWEELDKLFRVMWSGQWAVVTPYNLLIAVWHILPDFRGFKQQDAQELMMRLTERLKDELVFRWGRPGLLSPSAPWSARVLMQLMVGNLQQCVSCKTCGAKSVRDDPYSDISLELGAGTYFGSWEDLIKGQ